VLVEERKPETTEAKIKEPSEKPIKEEPAPADTKKLGCTHHFGYLSKRPTKEKIPEECIVCESIVQCMLKNVTG
jgi:hypothetical protein